MRRTILAVVTLAIMLSASQLRLAAAASHPAIQHWAIIVAGTVGPDDPNRSQEDLQTAEVYDCLLARSYLADHIYYISWNTARNGVDNVSSYATVEYAFTSWLAERSDANDVVFIYFLGHGNYLGLPPMKFPPEPPHSSEPRNTWYFLINGTREDGPVLMVTQLALWIEHSFSYGKLFFVLEACFGGALIPILATVPGQNRIVATSTDAENLAHNDGYNPPYLPLFSHRFFECLEQKTTVGKAFNEGYLAAKHKQDALLDDNCDGVGHSPVPDGGDGTLGFSVTWLPGDITGDGKVDIKDIAIVAKAYETQPGDPDWNPRADLSGNNYVNFLDLGMASDNYGYPIA